MRYIFILLALAGIIVSGLALHEHYRTEGIAPCSINDKWDCGVVNKSDYSMIWKIPVGAIGVAGYLLLGILGGLRWYRLLTVATFGALGFSLYLTYVEARILETYCIYCVISFGIIITMTLLAVGTLAYGIFNARRTTA